MELDFLKQTTYANDSLANGQFLQMIMDMQETDTEPGQVYDHDVDEMDIELISRGEGVLEDEPDEEVEDETETQPGQELDEVDVAEQSIIQQMLMPMESRERRSRNDSPSYTPPANMANVPTELNWIKRKTDKVNISSLDSRISKYLNTLPEKFKSQIVATSGNDDKHKRGSKHYVNEGIDLRYNDELYKYILKDPTFKELGLETVNPNHGTAPHIHIETKQFGGYTHNSKYQIDNEKMF